MRLAVGTSVCLLRALEDKYFGEVMNFLVSAWYSKIHSKHRVKKGNDFLPNQFIKFCD
jgi:hypothetical protein